MKVAIHQPHYFPWLGYLAKMAEADLFILLDEVQLEKGSYMYRNRIVTPKGEIKYLTISADKHGFLDRHYNELHVKNCEIWKKNQIETVTSAYGNSRYFPEVFEIFKRFLDRNDEMLCGVTSKSIMILKELFKINTTIVFQSDLNYDRSSKKNDLVLELCKTVRAAEYLSGNGASKYMEIDKFTEQGIRVEYQAFHHPVYTQLGIHKFEPGLSALDILFTCGLERAKQIFWESVKNHNII